ncbi:class F sortase [Kitasatospora sp. NPDC086009]|uniref:class F sortase n=1 Tax=unclassified Kitasatospora TaxID=2633591 RepID=UPI0037C62BA9
MRAADDGSGHSDGFAAAAAPDGSPVARPAYGDVRGPGDGPGRAGAGPGTDHQAQPAPDPGRERAPGSGPGNGSGTGPTARRARRDATRWSGGRRPRRTGCSGSVGVRRAALGAGGLLCLVLGASVALSGTQTPVVRIQPSVNRADPAVPAADRAGGPATGPAAASGAATPAPRPFAASAPTRLVVPSAGVDAPVSGLGLNPDGTVEVPSADRADEVGWYRNGPTPGETGPAVLIGHYDTVHGPAVFAGLPKLRPGDLVQVRRADGSTVEFRVRSLLQAGKDRFPTETVYGNTSAPELRLITCGGRIGSDGHWTDNIIVLADLVPPGAPAS